MWGRSVAKKACDGSSECGSGVAGPGHSGLSDLGVKKEVAWLFLLRILGVFDISVFLHPRPDLLDFESLKKCNAHYNLQNAFNLAEKELGLTKLLDPEGGQSCANTRPRLTDSWGFSGERWRCSGIRWLHNLANVLKTTTEEGSPTG